METTIQPECDNPHSEKDWGASECICDELRAAYRRGFRNGVAKAKLLLDSHLRLIDKLKPTPEKS